MDYLVFVKRIQRLDDFNKLYGELKLLNRLLTVRTALDEVDQLKQKKKIVEDRLDELMYVTNI
jgi:hypothetical protein